MKRKIQGAASAATFSIALVLAGPADAHHSYAQFDPCEGATLEGEIERVAWANPHIVMTVRSEDAGTYRIEWFDLQQLQRAGLAKGVLQPGDRVVVTGSRHRDSDLKIMTLLTEVRRPSDGWRWSLGRTRGACQ